MKYAILVLLIGAVSFFSNPASAQSLTGAEIIQALEGRDLEIQLRERQQKIMNLSDSEKALLNAARAKAMEDPAVKAALAARSEAVKTFRASIETAMIKSDPTVAAILSRAPVTPEP